MKDNQGSAKPLKSRWSDLPKKKKIGMLAIVCATVIVVAAAITIPCVLFTEPVYEVDLERIRRAENLSWSDEFNDGSLDADVWQAASDYDVGGAYHMPQAVREADDNLNIDIFYNEEVGQWWCGGIDTMPSENHSGFTRKYGYFEISAKLADMGGIWCTFWLLAPQFDSAENDDASVWGAELDILEAPLYPKNKIQQAVHIGGWGKAYSTSLPNPKYGMQDIGKNIYDTYNTYGLYWNEEIYKFYVNGKCMWTTKLFRQYIAAGAGHLSDRRNGGGL